MNKEDFQLKYPNHGHKFYDAFRQLIHQIQAQQQQQQHSPTSIEGNNANDLLGLQSKFNWILWIFLWRVYTIWQSTYLDSPVVHHHQTNGDCWSMMPPAVEQNYLHPNSMVLPDNNIGGYCGAQDRQQYQMDSSYAYLNSANHHSHHHHHQSKGLSYGDPLQIHNGFQQQQQQHQLQHHESYDSYSSLDMMGVCWWIFTTTRTSRFELFVCVFLSLRWSLRELLERNAFRSGGDHGSQWRHHHQHGRFETCGPADGQQTQQPTEEARSRLRKAVGIHPRSSSRSQILSQHGPLGGRQRRRFPHRSEREVGQLVGHHQEQSAHDVRKT